MELTPGSFSNGFKVVSVKNLEEYKATGIELEHIKTGCEVFHMSNEDCENLFSFNFRTIPYNNNGIAHILEHSVLCGSKRFVIKDPFASLLKSSMNTFLNAMTYPDKTIYPASSTVEKDLFNLMMVYGDAVFFPLLREEVFHQEGYRYKIDNGKLNIAGVVFSEMKGAYSNHDSIVNEWSYRVLFPDSPYRFDSGGEPASIPSLDYREFLDFHKKYYHPSNCKIFLYGNIDTEKYLSFINDNFLCHFNKKDIDLDISCQKRWDSPIVVRRTSPVEAGEGKPDRASVIVSWLLDEISDPFLLLSFEVLSEILIGNDASPLYKAIIESKLGEDLSPVSGFESDLKETVFSVGIRGCNPEDQAEIKALILKELEKLREQKIHDDIIRGTINRVEFRNKEIKGGIPYGLRALEKMLRGWMHGASPADTLEFSRWMNLLKNKLKTDRCYFENLIGKYLLKNPHHALIIVEPDKKHRENSLDSPWFREKEKLLTKDKNKISEIKNISRQMAIFQETPDNPEDIEKIPHLDLSDLPKKVENIELIFNESPYSAFYIQERFTNGIVYVEMAFDVSGLDEYQKQLLTLFSRVVCSSGFKDVGYEIVARELALKTGGFTGGVEAGNILDSAGCGEFLFFRIKILNHKFEEGISLVQKILMEADFDNLDRIENLLLELRNDIRSSVIPNGHSFVALYAGSFLSASTAREESFSGISQLLFLNNLLSIGKIESISADLKKIRGDIFSRPLLSVNITTQKDFINKSVDILDSVLRGFPSENKKKNRRDPRERGENSLKKYTGLEALQVSSTVGYSSTVIPASFLDSDFHAFESVLAHILKTGYLWENIRMKGGAYGAFASANGVEGLFSFLSYRDPEISRSLNIYRDALGKEDIPASVVEKAIIGVVGKESRPLSPGEKSIIGFRRKLFGIRDELRQKRREKILSAGFRDINSAKKRLFGVFDSSISVVMGDIANIESLYKFDKQIKNRIIKVPL